MLIVPERQDRERARALFGRFSSLPGAQHIASAFALAYLSRLITVIKPKSVLEYGAGIGTITKLLLEHPFGPQLVVSTENNEFCLDALRKNVGTPNERWRIVADIDNLVNLHEEYDLVIFDGVLGDERQYSMFREGVICFVEGNRGPTRVALENSLGARGLTCHFTNYTRSPRLQIKWSKRYGFLPKRIKIVRKKGCYIGAVTKAASASNMNGP